MNKENNRSAAGLRRSAVAERIRLREEWSELKGTPDMPLTSQNRQHQTVLAKKPQTIRNYVNRRPVTASSGTKRTINVAKSVQMSGEVLMGVVALVEVGAESRALALRAALGALGATVVPTWSPIVTHVVWAQGGCRATRAKARALASRLVSPLWVEACAASNKRLPEQVFPAATRPSDLPSPKTLRQLLKKAEMENIPLVDLLSDDKDDEKDPKAPRLRMSSETEADTSADTSKDTTHDSSRDKDSSYDSSKERPDILTRVNTAPRRALPMSTSPAPPAKSRRKLFTHKEGDVTKTKATDDETDAETTAAPKRVQSRPTHRERRELVRAERLARRLVAACGPAPTQLATHLQKPRIVLTGMGRSERQAVIAAVRQLHGRLQKQVSWKTTHVLLGSCQEEANANICSGITTNRYNISGVTSLDEPLVVHRSDIQKARTLNSLAGAARGCRVLQSQWALDSVAANKWLHHHGYEVPHLKKMSQKARVERTALCRMRSDYAYDVFSGMRVRITSSTEQKDAATQLLKLCGGIPLDGSTSADQCDMTLGVGNGEVNSKWVFDSVAAGRMRTARRYINNSASQVLTQSNR